MLYTLSFTTNHQGVQPNEYHYICHNIIHAMWSNISYLLHSQQARRILKALVKRRTPTQLAKQLNMSTQGVSKIILKLRHRRLVTCLNPKDFSYRIYESNRYGKKVLRELENF